MKLLIFRFVHDDGHRLAAVPHEQREVPARARLRQGRLLRAHQPLQGDMLPGVGRRPGCGHHQVQKVPQAHVHIQDYFQGEPFF